MNKQILLHKNKIQIHKKQIQFGGGKKLKVSYNNFNYIFDKLLYFIFKK